MKKIVEKVVDRNQDIIQYITRIAIENPESWIYISANLYEYLENKYNHVKFIKNNGTRFIGEKNSWISITNSKYGIRSVWNEVISFSEAKAFATSLEDPKTIVFLS